MSSMLSAPAAMPATREDSFRPALAPLSVGTLIRSSASSRRPALRATAISGIRPAADTRLGSSNVADTTGRVWESCIYKMPFLHWRYGPSASPIFPVQRGVLAFCDLQLIGGSRLRRSGTATQRTCGARPLADPGLQALPDSGVALERLRQQRVVDGVGWRGHAGDR